MKLNLEKNFKSLFKKKVSFTMAALTIFAITGSIGYADDIAANKKAIEDEVTRSTGKDTEHDTKIAENKAGIKANASAIKHLDSKLNKTTAMMTAMNNVDFQDVNAGEVAIGAGVGHFVGDQAVAVGVAYGVNDDLKVHAKWSGVAGDPHYNAIGGGVTYKFRTR